jgi:hypothetical protein
MATSVTVVTWGKRWGTSVSIVSGYRLDDRGSRVRSQARTKYLSSNLLCPDQLRGPPSLLFSGYLVVKRGRCVTLTTDPHLVPTSTMRSYTSSSPWSLHSGSGTVLLSTFISCASTWKNCPWRRHHPSRRPTHVIDPQSVVMLLTPCTKVKFWRTWQICYAMRFFPDLFILMCAY